MHRAEHIIHKNDGWVRGGEVLDGLVMTGWLNSVCGGKESSVSTSSHKLGR